MAPKELEFVKKNCTDILEIAGVTHGHGSYKTMDINPYSGADIIGDAHAIPLPDKSQDAVVAFNLIEHLHSPHIFVEEVKRVLRPQGRILITAPFIHPYHGGVNRGTFCPDYYRFTKDGLAYLFRDFTIEITSDGGFFYSMGWFLPSLQRLLFAADRLYPNGLSRHQYTVTGIKK